jgi:hypothetical protein
MGQPPQQGPLTARRLRLPKAPEELTRARLRRLGEGLGRVVYASEHWVVKRERHPTEIMALVMLWRIIRRLQRHLPGRFGQGLFERPSLTRKVAGVLLQGVVMMVPRGVWFASHIGELWRWYAQAEARGDMLARKYLAGTGMIPETVHFPPTRVQVDMWPGWLLAEEATQRVETTLFDRINDLARAHRFDEIEVWLERFLALRQAGWQRGVFSLDAHLQNFGVMGERVVLLDAGGLTNRWADIAERLQSEDRYLSPHSRLGLEMTLRDRPDIAARFNARWRAIVNAGTVRDHWPATFRDRQATDSL